MNINSIFLLKCFIIFIYKYTSGIIKYLLNNKFKFLNLFINKNTHKINNSYIL